MPTPINPQDVAPHRVSPDSRRSVMERTSSHGDALGAERSKWRGWRETNQLIDRAMQEGSRPEYMRSPAGRVADLICFHAAERLPDRPSLGIPCPLECVLMLGRLKSFSALFRPIIWRSVSLMGASSNQSAASRIDSRDSRWRAGHGRCRVRPGRWSAPECRSSRWWRRRNSSEGSHQRLVELAQASSEGDAVLDAPHVQRQGSPR